MSNTALEHGLAVLKTTSTRCLRAEFADCLLVSYRTLADYFVAFCPLQRDANGAGNRRQGRSSTFRTLRHTCSRCSDDARLQAAQPLRCSCRQQRVTMMRGARPLARAAPPIDELRGQGLCGRHDQSRLHARTSHRNARTRAGALRRGHGLRPFEFQSRHGLFRARREDGVSESRKRRARQARGDDTRCWESRHANLRAVLLDTKGPEVRTGTLPGNADSFIIEDGMEVCCTFDDVSSDEPVKPGDSKCRLHVDYESLPSTVSIGSKILLDDGLISLQVTSIGSDSVTAIAENSGPIKARKGVNLPGSILDLPALTPKDKEDIQWAVETGADFVALSFVRSARNVRSCRAFMERCCPDQKTRMPQIISKIENQEGVDNFDEILEASMASWSRAAIWAWRSILRRCLRPRDTWSTLVTESGSPLLWRPRCSTA